MSASGFRGEPEAKKTPVEITGVYTSVGLAHDASRHPDKPPGFARRRADQLMA